MFAFSTRLVTSLAVASLLATTVSDIAGAQVASFLPPIQHAGGIQYRTGGIGLDESTALLDAAKTSPLTLFFVTHFGGNTVYASATRVTLSDAKGKQLLELKPDGPILLLDLAPGKYTIEASYGQQSQTHKVDVEADKRKRLYFVWKEEEAG
ncbi:MAG TPA: carboxypeptidase regulatory-like domain-containing protein [Burkholderiaceae bacterium]